MDSIKIAIFTDTHLGYDEKDIITGSDSFTIFNEALDISIDNNVDCIIHAGDLFHSKNPSIKTAIKTNEIIYNHRFPIPNQDLSENPISFTEFQGEQIKSRTPFFIIQGNHDKIDKVDSAINLVSASGLIYYFKDNIADDSITLNPVMIERGNIEVALYGMGHMENFRQLLKNTISGEGKKIVFENIPDAQNNESDNNQRFNILLLHQDSLDRADFRENIPEMVYQICSWMNLVVWGHEHENCIEPRSVSNSETFKITQPGSTIITDFRKYKQPKRSMAILEIFQNRVDFKNIFLKTPRSYRYSRIKISDYEHILNDSDLWKKKDNESLLQYQEQEIKTKIQDMINSIDEEERERLPFIRLVLEFDPPSYGKKFPISLMATEFSSQVANSSKIFMVSCSTKNKVADPSDDNKTLSENPILVQSLESQIFENSLKSDMLALPAKVINQAIQKFSNNTQDKKIFQRYAELFIRNTKNMLLPKIPESEKALDYVEISTLINDNVPDIQNITIDSNEYDISYSSPRKRGNKNENEQPSPKKTTSPRMKKIQTSPK